MSHTAAPSPRILPFTAADSAEVEALLDCCFGPARHRRTASRLRAGAPRLADASFVARLEGRLVGAVQCFELLAQRPGQAACPIVLLGPLVSHPDCRGEGIGTRLMNQALAGIDALDLPVMLIGDEPYYRRWRFSAMATTSWRMPGPVDRARLLLRAPHPEAFADAFVFHAPGEPIPVAA